MQQGDRFMTIITVVLIGIMLQILLAFADHQNTPAKTAVAFSEAYFNLDPTMANYLCSDYVGSEEPDIVREYLTQVADDAKTGGFDFAYMRSRLFSVHTEIISQDDSRAEVRITAQRKRNINPIFTLVGKLFSIGETYTVDETLQLVKEDGEWKVCDGAFSLSI